MTKSVTPLAKMKKIAQKFVERNVAVVPLQRQFRNDKICALTREFLRAS